MKLIEYIKTKKRELVENNKAHSLIDQGLARLVRFKEKANKMIKRTSKKVRTK